MSNQKRVRLFRNGRNQAVRIPMEFELPGDEAIMHREGDRRVMEPVRKRGLIGLLKSMTPLDEEFPEVDGSRVGAGARAVTPYMLDTNILLFRSRRRGQSITLVEYTFQS
jgi:antitoxin VapB